MICLKGLKNTIDISGNFIKLIGRIFLLRTLFDNQNKFYVPASIPIYKGYTGRYFFISNNHEVN